MIIRCSDCGRVLWKSEWINKKIGKSENIYKSFCGDCLDRELQDLERINEECSWKCIPEKMRSENTCTWCKAIYGREDDFKKKCLKA